MARKTVGLSGTEALERFSTTFAADYRFGPLNILVLLLLCLAGLAVHLVLHTFDLGTVIDVLAVALSLAFLLRVTQIWESALLFTTVAALYLFLRHRPESEVLVATVIVAGLPLAGPADGLAVGARGHPALRPLPRPEGLGALPDHSRGRQGVELRRPAHPGHRLQRRDDPHPRHGARQRRRDRVLDGVGRREVDPGGRGLRRRGDAVGPDRPARRDRQARARRHAVAPRPPGQGDPAGARREDERLGHHRPVGGDPGHHHPQGARGRDEPPGAGRARAPGAHHPGDGRDRDRREVRGGLATTTRTTRWPCTCGR